MIPVWDYRREYEACRDDILGAVDRVFRSGRLILGEEVTSFEAEMAAACGASFGIGVNSATDALFLALKALGVGDGDEVITVTNTAVPTVSAIVSAGAVPRFVDIDPITYLMDPALIEAAITPRTKVILPVHLYGQCAVMEEVCAIARRHGLAVVEDCAQSAGASRHGTGSGSFGDAGAFSFYPTKVLGGYGDGGMVTTSRQDLADKIRSLRMYGMAGTYYAEEHGYNSRLDEVHAAILRFKLTRLGADVERRRAIAAIYGRELSGLGLTLPVEAPGNHHTYYVYVVRHPERARVMEELKAAGVFTNISYPFPIHTMRGYAHFGGRVGDLPHSERAAGEVFSLPMFATLSDAEVEQVCAAFRKVLG